MAAITITLRFGSIMRIILVILAMGLDWGVAGLNLNNNECPTYVEYFFRFIDGNCRYNDELFLHTPQILSKRNISYETHQVTTEDGYILTLFRVTKTNPKGVIVLIHPIVQDSTTWLLGGNSSYVTIFANAGYELWLLNWRGVTYSDKHVKKLSQLEYWDFSFHEIGIYDLSAVFRYVNNVTDSKVISFSMSIGSSAATIYASERPEEAERLVKIFIALAVPAFMEDSTSIVRILIPLIPLVKEFQRISGVGALFYGTRPLTNLGSGIALALNSEWLFSLVIPAFVGGTPAEIDPKNIPMGVSITPEPISLKALYHFAQLLTNGNQFVQYDYGKTKNLQVYDSEKPPRYHVENISVPFFIIFGEKDNLANKNGNLLLYSKLPEAVKVNGYLEIPGGSHADFLVGRHVPQIVQNRTLEILGNL